MLKLQHENTLIYYVSKYNLNNIFDIDISKNMELHCFNKNEFIALKDSNPKYLYFLVEGTAINFETLHNPQSKSNFIYNDFNIIGALELFVQSSFNYNIKALTDCICIGIPISIIKDLAFKDTNFLKYFCELFSSKIYDNRLNLDFFNKEKDAI
jgi:signal-transduction protein with cAMP-binding, CBS, and nucleotidyltransferase domain